MSDKTVPLVTRVRPEKREDLERLADAYETTVADVLRRWAEEGLRTWSVPGFTKRPRPKH